MFQHLQHFEILLKYIKSAKEIFQVREAGTPHPRKKIETYLGIMGYLWALEWRKK